MLMALLFALLVAAAPASAFEDWEHGGAKESTCDSSGCHKDDQPITNTACIGCHSGRTTSGSQKCWDCHAPGATPPSSCADSCHLFQASGDEDYSYSIAFTHGTTPHLGASGYGKTCIDCHGAGGAHHDAAAASAPACATCHNGAYAAAPVGHEGRSSDCQSCHTGMNRPSGDCASCHVGNPGSGGPQITYSSSQACADAGCHGKVKNHVGTSIGAAACTTCHAEHYKSLGACTKCHADPQRFHHGTAQATPLTDCAGCHNGSIAAAPPLSHAAYGTQCASCHTGMNLPSGDCATCHAKAQGTWPAVVSTNPLACADAGCHGKVKNHVGTSIGAAACTTCHAEHYKSLGACTKCHADPKSFHHGTAKATPLADCATCHNGSIAAAPPLSHAAYGTQCASCHMGMNRPSGDCATCHAKAQGTWPAVVSTNPLTCADARCHGKVANHSGTLITDAPCTTCHTEHYKSLGACTKCHANPRIFHHGIAKATPLADCAGCHNGALAGAHGNHGTLKSCTPCHDGGMKRPSVPGVCVTCHDVGTTTPTSCLAGGCHTSKQLHAPGPAGGVDCAGCHSTTHYKAIASCTTCHPDRVGYHHKGVKATPLADCGGCHDGRIASARKAHAGLTCAKCHTGMARPPVPATCQDCHDAQTFGSAVCTTCHSKTGMIGKETVHATDPVATVSCTTCHKKHYEGLGACDTCHGSHAETHHGTATLADTLLKLAARPAQIKAHQKSTLKGRLRADGQALAAQSVLIQARRLKGGSFKDVAVVTTGADGRFSRIVEPRVGAEYRAVWRPTGAYVTQLRPAIDSVKLRVRK